MCKVFVFESRNTVIMAAKAEKKTAPNTVGASVKLAVLSVEELRYVATQINLAKGGGKSALIERISKTRFNYEAWLEAMLRGLTIDQLRTLCKGATLLASGKREEVIERLVTATVAIEIAKFDVPVEEKVDEEEEAPATSGTTIIPVEDANIREAAKLEARAKAAYDRAQKKIAALRSASA